MTQLTVADHDADGDAVHDIPATNMKDPASLFITNNNTMVSADHNVRVPMREMAVDVPDTFVGVAKTAPRYPPPHRQSDQSSSLKRNGLYRFAAAPTATPTDTPINHARSKSVQDGQQESSENRTPPTPRISDLVRDQSKPDSNGVSEEEKLIELGQLSRIRKYQDDLRRRKEEEDRRAEQDDFLRSSLRGSQKLRALEKKLKSGTQNDAFLPDDSDDVRQASTELTELHDAESLLSLLRHVSGAVSDGALLRELGQVERLLREPHFQSCLQLHNAVQERACFRCLPTPACDDAHTLTLEVARCLESDAGPQCRDSRELLGLLDGGLSELMRCHDSVAAAVAVPDATEEEELLARLSAYAEDSIKVVRIEKTTEPLGATVKNDGEAVIIGRIVKGGIAEKSGLLHEGDELLEVNGTELRGKSVNDVCDIMATLSGTLTFLIVPTQFDSPKSHTRDGVMHLKAHFDYEPDDDLYVPCRELGMSFQKGDVLHVIGQDDPSWWQAYREGEEDQLLAGLIPSKNFQQQREIMKQAVIGDTREKKPKKGGKLLCARRHHRRKKKKLYNLNYNDDTDSDQILTYEEVRLYYPRAHQKRPIVLIGPQKVGRHELRQRLMEDTNRFAAAVPHTSRPRKEHEVSGQDYCFISRAQFEADIVAGRFVEHGEYQKSYYGTSIDAIRSVIDAGKTCVLNLHPQSLKILKKSDLMPYIVFVAPPSLEKLRQNCLKTDGCAKDDELKEIIERARHMEEFYGHYFDLVLINVDLDKTYAELVHEVSVIEREPQWVPAAWIRDDAP